MSVINNAGIMIMNMKKILVALIVLQILLWPLQTAAVAEAGKQFFAAKATPRRPAHKDAALAISPDTVFYRIKNGQAPVLVDVRNKADFERLRIPGSINLPLHALKTREFLKSAPLILVSEGYHYAPLRKACRELRNLGFTVSILDGGLIGWRHKKGALQGDLFALSEWRQIPPQLFFQEKDFKSRIMIDVSESRSAESQKLLPDALNLPWVPDAEKCLRSLRKILSEKQKKPFVTLLLFNTTGRHYERIAAMLEKAGIANAFFLEGGLDGYRRFLRNLALSRQSRESRIKRVTTCKKCMASPAR